MFERMATFARVVHFDKRGTGMSDRTPMPTLDQRVDDTRAVMDAAGVERAVLHGVSEGGPLAVLFAADLSRACELVDPAWDGGAVRG